MMRRFTGVLVVLLAALLFAGTASAYQIDVTADKTEAGYTDVIEVDVTIDTTGTGDYGLWMTVNWDPTVLSFVSGTNTPPVPAPYAVYWSVPQSAGVGWMGYLAWAPYAPSVSSLATLVFHVMDVDSSTITSITPAVTVWMGGGGGASVPQSDMVLNGADIHIVPEPTTTILMGLGLFGILYAGRRH